MNTKHAQQRKKRIHHLRLVKKGSQKRVRVNYFKMAMLAAAATSLIALGQVVQYSMYNQVSFENDTIKKEISSLKEDKQELESAVMTLKSPIRIERIAKNDLKMEKPSKMGYIVYQLKDNKSELALKH